jgi:hypothetical protein
MPCLVAMTKPAISTIGVEAVAEAKPANSTAGHQRQCEPLAEAIASAKVLALLKKISPVWQHIHFHGHYTFCGSRHPIDLDAMVANLTLGEGEQGLPRSRFRGADAFATSNSLVQPTRNSRISFQKESISYELHRDESGHLEFQD